LQGGNSATDLIKPFDVLIQRVALGLADALIGQMIAEIGAAGRSSVSSLPITSCGAPFMNSISSP
jgi:hypothetical protein